MMNWIKHDFRKVREQLSYVFKREIPIGIAAIYYIIAGVLFLPLSILLWIGTKIYFNILIWKIKRGI